MSTGSGNYIPSSYEVKTSGLTKQELEKAKLSQACKMFESYFLKEMMSAMRSTLTGEHLLHGGNAENIFTDMLDQAYADEAVQGEGVGLSAVLEQQLTKQAPVRTNTSGLGSIASYGSSTGSAVTIETPLQGDITSLFGQRIHPITGEEHTHTGLDLAAPEGTDIEAAASGEVVFAGEKGGYGNLVIIEHSDGQQTYYAHCSELLVEQGQKVTKGQTIAEVGSTGSSTGPHLHFELRDASGTPQDPLPIIKAGLNLTA